ncbi:MAG: cytochrome P450 [Burkholderiales bacterium]|nr:cytochrome P450 [Burkholderiales bacterium]
MPPEHAIAAVTHDEPFPYYRGLREERPLFFDGKLNLWVATGHAVVTEAFTHPKLWVRPPAEPVPKALLGTAAGEVFAQLVRMTDGAFHAAHKPAMEQAARRWTLADVARASTQAAQDLRPRLGANAFMAALPVQAMARLLGVPAELLDVTGEQVAHFVRGIGPAAAAQDIEQADSAARALMVQGATLGLAPVQAASRIAFMQQSLDATWALMAHTALMLGQDQALAATADESADGMRRFVAEVERHASPTQNTRRFAAQPLELAGRAIGEGQGVLLVLAAANRDEALNPQPDRFDPARTQPRSMGFGSGRHGCPGTAIAIEIVAACAGWMRSAGQFSSYFGAQTGFRTLGNIRCPLLQE